MLLIISSFFFTGNIQAAEAYREITRSEISFTPRKFESASFVFSFRKENPRKIFESANYTGYTLLYKRLIAVALKTAIGTRTSFQPIIIDDHLYKSNRIISEDSFVLIS